MNNTWYLGSVEYNAQCYFNDKIIREIDKKECEKIINQINDKIIQETDKKECDKINDKPFIVVSVATDYNIIKHVNYLDRFSFEQEAKEFVLNKEKAKDESFRVTNSCRKIYGNLGEPRQLF